MENFIIVQIIENLLEDSVKNNVGQDGTILEEVLVNTVKATMTVVIWMWWKMLLLVKCYDKKWLSCQVSPICRISLMQLTNNEKSKFEFKIV